MKGLVILIGVAVLAFVVFLWTPSQEELIQRAVPGSPALAVPPIPDIPDALQPRAPLPDRPEQLDCLQPDFIRDKNVDRDWDQCPELI